MHSIEEFYAMIGLAKFDLKNAVKYLIFDLGFWLRKLLGIFKKLRVFSMDLPVLYLEEVDPSIEVMKNLKTLSLGSRLTSLEKGNPNLNQLLGMLNPSEITGLYLGEANAENEKEFRIRLDKLTLFSSLQYLTIAQRISKISVQLFELICLCLSQLKELRRLTFRLANAQVEDPDWKSKLRKIFQGLKLLDYGLILIKNDSFEFERV